MGSYFDLAEDGVFPYFCHCSMNYWLAYGDILSASPIIRIVMANQKYNIMEYNVITALSSSKKLRHGSVYIQQSLNKRISNVYL